MTVENKDNPGQAGAGSSDGTQNTANQQDNQAIPYARFKEVNDRAKAAETELEKLRKDAATREEADRMAKGEHEKIIAELKPQAEAAKRLNQALEEIFKLELEGVPEDMRDLIPQGDVSTRLTWLKVAKTRGFFTKPVPPVMDAGASGGGTVAAVKLTDEQKQAAKRAGMTEEQYVKAFEVTNKGKA